MALEMGDIAVIMIVAIFTNFGAEVAKDLYRKAKEIGKENADKMDISTLGRIYLWIEKKVTWAVGLIFPSGEEEDE